MPSAALLLSRIAAHAAAASRPDPWRKEDLQDLVLNTLATVRSHLRFSHAERVLVAQAKIDAPALRAAVAIFDRLDSSRFDLPSALVFDPRQRIRELEELIDSVAQAERLHELEVGLRLELAGDAWFDFLLCGLADLSDVSPQLEELLMPKLHLLSDEDAIAVWTRLASESDPEGNRISRIERSDEVVAADFYAIGSAQEARAKTARYITNVRPRLERRMLLAGVTRFPTGLGIAKVLSWTASVASEDISELERQAIRAVARVAACCKRLGIDSTLVASAARLSPGGYSLSGRGFAGAERGMPEGGGEPEPALLFELEGLLRAYQDVHAAPSPIENVLRHFKLGLEVAAPDERAQLSRRNEVALQRILCRFLVERGFRAVGTKFGSSEADLHVEDALHTLVVEAKLVTEAPSARNVNKWLSQLKSYMDQGPINQTGSLVLFNFGRVPIFAPQHFIRARHMILPINLGSESPSRRREFVDIEDVSADSDEMVRVFRNSAEARGEDRRRSRPSPKRGRR